MTRPLELRGGFEIVLGDRASGKSTESVRWAAQDPTRRVVVTANQVGAKYLAGLARTLYPARDVDWTKVFVASTASQFLWGRDVTVRVDELQLVLQTLLGVSVDGVTATGSVYDIGGRHA